jgi:hypothetical protein
MHRDKYLMFWCFSQESNFHATGVAGKYIYRYLEIWGTMTIILKYLFLKLQVTVLHFTRLERQRMSKYSLTSLIISGYKQVYTQYMEGYTDIIWRYDSISSSAVCCYYMFHYSQNNGGSQAWSGIQNRK